MLATSWRLCAAIHNCLQLRAPSNLLIAQIRARRRRTAVVVLAGLATTICVALAGLCARQDGGPAWLSAAVALLIWYGFKFAWVALLPAETYMRHQGQTARLGFNRSG